MAAESSIAAGTSRPLSKSVALALYGVVGLALLALVVLLVRELMPHHATTLPVAHHDDIVAAPVPVAPVAPAPAADGQGNGHGHDKADTQAAAPMPKSDGLVRVRALASLIANPESRPSTGVFHNRASNVDHYSYDDSFGPFRRGSLKRNANNPAAWEFDASDGPKGPTKLEDITPAGGLHEAATVKDEQGNPVTTWFSIDSGPLAPAYATRLAAGGARVVSRAYLEENATQFPAALTAVLAH